MRIQQLGFFSLLGLLFIALKLTGVITWSWWLVLLPLYFGLAIVAIFLGGVALIALGLVVIAVVGDIIAAAKGK